MAKRSVAPCGTWHGTWSRCSFSSYSSASVMEAGEVEFLAEKELVTITPNFSENKMSMISVREPQAY